MKNEIFIIFHRSLFIIYQYGLSSHLVKVISVGNYTAINVPIFIHKKYI